MSQNPIDLLIKYSEVAVDSLPAEVQENLKRMRARCEELVPAPRQYGKYNSVDLLAGARPNGNFPPHRNCKECGTA